MNIARKVCITLAAMSVTLGLVAVAAPAEASRDTSWGCGGMCISVPDEPTTPDERATSDEIEVIN